MTTDERLRTEIEEKDVAMRRRVRVEVTADPEYEDKFNEIRDAVREILNE